MKKHNGFTLIELLIAMVLGLMLVAGMATMYLSTKSSYNAQNSLLEVQEAGRYIIEAIKQDFRQSDNWGCSQATTNVLNSAGSGYVDYLAEGVDGVDSTNDTLTIRRADVAGVQLQNDMFDEASDIVVGTTAFTQGQVVIINDCLSGDIFQITNDPTSTTSLQHITGVGLPGNVVGELSKAYTTTARVYPIRSVSYSVANGWLQKTTDGVTENLLPNVERFQVLFGEDTDSDRVANRYVAASSVSDWGDVASIRVNILIKSTANGVRLSNQTYTFNGVTTTATDLRLYKVFSTTVVVRNRQKG